jgi:ABC-type nitrate/sulfonate/bicarbonate transport system ATPase subunit
VSLVLEQVCKSFPSPDGKAHVLLDVCLELCPRECVAILGPSGAGKTTLINLIAGYLFPDRGHVRANGKNVRGPGPDRIVVTQQDTLLPWLTVFENSCYAGCVGHFRSKGLEVRAASEGLLREFGVWMHRSKYPKALSGGERRRVELVRAFSVSPEFLLLDEPYSGLDERLRLELAMYVRRLREKSPEIAILLVTHDIEEACFLADRVLFLAGSPARIVAEEKIRLSRPRDSGLTRTEEFIAAVQRVRSKFFEVTGDSKEV